MMECNQSCNDKQLSVENLLLFIFFFLITAVVLIDLNKLNGIVIVGDEYGYWAAGAFFAGKDWSAVTSLNPYYAYGYGLVLSLIMRFTNNMVIAYKIAIILNAILLCLSFYLTVRICFFLFPEKSKKLLILVSGCVTLYSNNVLQSQTTQVEIFLYFLFCLLSYTLIRYLQSRKLRYGICLCIISVYMFTVHMRCISIFVTLALILLFLLYKKKVSLKHAAIMAVLAIGLLGISLVTKNEVKDNAYTRIVENNSNIEENVVSNNANDFSGQIGKIKSLFTLKGIAQFNISYLGKVYYLCASTFLFFLWAMFYLIKKLKNLPQEIDEKSIYAAFLLVCIVLTIAVSALFMIDITRQDTLIYGRYNEYILGPILAVGMIYFLDEKLSDKNHYLAIVLFCFLAILVYIVLDVTQIDKLYDNNVVGIVYWIIKIFGDVGKINFAFLVAAEALLAYFILILVKKCVKDVKIRYMLMGFFVSTTWIICANEVFEHNIKRQQEKVETSYELIRETGDEKNIYFLNTSTEYIYVDYLQFYKVDARIKFVDEADVELLENGSYIFTYKNQFLDTKKYFLECKGESEHFVLYQRR